MYEAIVLEKNSVRSHAYKIPNPEDKPYICIALQKGQVVTYRWCNSYIEAATYALDLSVELRRK